MSIEEQVTALRKEVRRLMREAKAQARSNRSLASLYDDGRAAAYASMLYRLDAILRKPAGLPPATPRDGGE